MNSLRPQPVVRGACARRSRSRAELERRAGDNAGECDEAHGLGRLDAPRAQRRSRRSSPSTTRRTRMSTSTSSAASTTTRSSPPSAPATRRTSSARSTSTNVGAYCASGGWIDLGPSLKKRQGRPRTSSRRRRATTRSTRASSCALPLLADTYGLYYNKTLFGEGRPDEAAEDVLGADRRTRRS